MSNSKPIRRVAIIGTGVIGASWSALFLAKGLDVVATDVAPDAEAALKRFVEAAWPALERLGLASGASQSRLTFTARYAGRCRSRGLCPGKRARADRLQEEALSPARRPVARRCDHRFELIGSHHERNSIGVPPPSRALRHRPPVQSTALGSAGRIVGGAKTSEATIRARSRILHGLGKRPYA